MTDPYHLCFAVADLEQAMADFTATAGTRWNAVRAGQLSQWSYRIVFSVGTPLIELIEGPPGSPWDVTGGPRFDHLGWWADDLAATTDRLAGAGLCLAFDGREHGRRFVYHDVASIGARFEVVDAANRADFAATWDVPASSPHHALTDAQPDSAG